MVFRSVPTLNNVGTLLFTYVKPRFSSLTYTPVPSFSIYRKDLTTTCQETEIIKMTLNRRSPCVILIIFFRSPAIILIIFFRLAAYILILPHTFLGVPVLDRFGAVLIMIRSCDLIIFRAVNLKNIRFALLLPLKSFGVPVRILPLVYFLFVTVFLKH